MAKGQKIDTEEVLSKAKFQSADSKIQSNKTEKANRSCRKSEDDSLSLIAQAREHARKRMAKRQRNQDLNAASSRVLEKAMASDSLRPFIYQWNRDHPDISFCIGATAPAGPACIMVRFDAEKYLQNQTIRERSRLSQQLRIESGHMLFLADDTQQLMQAGIIDIDVACAKPGYSDQHVIDGLKWLGEVFLMGEQKQ